MGITAEAYRSRLYASGGADGYLMEEIMREQFEKWYCDKYWNFKGVENRQVFFELYFVQGRQIGMTYGQWSEYCKKNGINPQLSEAYQQGYKQCLDVLRNDIARSAGRLYRRANHKHTCNEGECLCCRADELTSLGIDIEFELKEPTN